MRAILMTLALVLAAQPALGAEPPADLAAISAQAEAGDPVAQNHLGYVYRTGLGVPKDMARAIAWYRKAAEQGHLQAQKSLGYIYNRGEGVPMDKVAGFHWYRQAAEQGDPTSLNNVAVAYATGTGVARDEALAIRFYGRAIAAGNTGAAKNLQILQNRQRRIAGAEAAQEAAAQEQELARQREAMLNLGAAPTVRTGAGKASDRGFGVKINVYVRNNAPFRARCEVIWEVGNSSLSVSHIKTLGPGEEAQFAQDGIPVNPMARCISDPSDPKAPPDWGADS